MKTLVLPLKKIWYDAIASGQKKEEYREITSYWQRRLSDHIYSDLYEIRHFENVTFTLGYPKKTDVSRRMTFRIEDITIREGKPEWGAEPDKQYFVIVLGERVN